MSNIIAGDPAPTNPTALGEFVGCFGSGCHRGEWTAKATERGWEQPAANEWLCPQCAANAADRADFIARQTTARERIADRLWLSMPGVDSVEAKARIDELLNTYRAEVLTEAANRLDETFRLAPVPGTSDGLNFAIGILMSLRGGSR